MLRRLGQTSIRGKIIGSYVLILAIVFAFGSYFLRPKTEEQRARILTLAEVTASFMAANLDVAVEFNDLSVIKASIKEAMKLRDCQYVAVSGSDGGILADSGELPESIHRLEMSGQKQEILDGYVIVRREITSEQAVIGGVVVLLSLREVLSQEKDHRWLLGAGGVIIGLVGLMVTFLLTRFVARPIANISDRVRRVAGGDLSVADVVVESKDEIGHLALDINQMIANLRRISEENEAVRWLKSGQAELSDNLRGELDMSVLCKNAVTFLAKYLEAQIGTLYVTTDNGSLRLMGSYAYTRRRQLNSEIEIGEGLVGQSALEKESITVSNVPENYVTIQSSLGRASPRTITVTPLLVGEDLRGILELGSLQPFSEQQHDLLSAVSENIAIAINSAKERRRARDLLEETQRQSKELQEQQQQLEKANQGLEEQAKSLRESEQQLKTQSEELQAANEELEEKTEYLERQKADIAQQNAQLEVAKKDIEDKACELELASKYKSEFLANMSHELRTPLNSLLILAKTLADNDDGNLTDDQVKSAQIIHGGGQDLLSLINDILDLSKVEAGMLEVHVQMAEIDSVVFGIREAFTPVAEQKGVELVTETTANVPPFIETDSQRAQQILRNLLSNAFKFTTNGSVTLRIHAPSRDVRFIRGDLSHDKALAFSVIDTGIGIPEDRQRAIFEAFQQADGGTSRKYGGTGLGLSISRELARLLGGEIHLESTPGQGSTFTLYLPHSASQAMSREEATTREETTARPAAAATRSAEAPTPPPSNHNGQHAAPAAPATRSFVADDRGIIDEEDKTILVVEDDADFAEILVKLARKRGYKCIAVPDGASALQLCSEVEPTAVLLDLGLPDIGGLRVLAQLKYDLETRHIPVHIISGREDAHVALQDGALGYLQKPASAESITEAFSKIEEVVERRVREVLVVQPSNGTRESLPEILANTNIKVTHVESGQEALEMLKAYPFHCIIVDDQLSDMTALEIVQQSGSNGNDELPPTIVYTQQPLDDGEQTELRKCRNAVVKSVSSLERVLDEATLFLHSVESSLSAEQQQTIRMLHDPDKLLHGRKVMLVDDDMRNTFALSKVLRDRGLKVIMADNGQVALEKLEEEEGVELVIMDIMMPVMDGYEAMRRIREDDRLADLPIVALTAKAMAEDRAKCLQAGANDYMTKPVDVERLVSLLRVWLFDVA